MKLNIISTIGITSFLLVIGCSSDFHVQSNSKAISSDVEGVDLMQKPDLVTEDIGADLKERQQNFENEVNSWTNNQIIEHMEAGKFANVCMFYNNSVSNVGHHCNGTFYKVILNGVDQDRRLNLKNGSGRDIAKEDTVTQTKAYRVQGSSNETIPGTLYEANWDESRFTIETRCIKADGTPTNCSHRTQQFISYSLIGAVNITDNGFTTTRYLRLKAPLNIQDGTSITFDWTQIDPEKLEFVDYVPKFDDFCNIINSNEENNTNSGN